MLWFIALNHSIVLAAVIGIARCRVYGPKWYPFLALVWLALVNESLSLYLLYRVHNNMVNSNIYTLLEYGLILLQMYNWNKPGKKLYALLAVAGTMIWVADNMVLHSLKDDNSFFRVCYSFIVVFLSIGQLNIRIITHKSLLRKDPVFIICCGFILYFSCRAFLEVFNLFAVSFSQPFAVHLFLALSVINCIANLIYATALLWIPVKQRYSWPS